MRAEFVSTQFGGVLLEPTRTGTLVRLSWKSHTSYMGDPRESRERLIEELPGYDLMETPWESHVRPVGQRNKPMEVPWESRGKSQGISMADLWELNPWGSHKSFMGQHHKAMGNLWKQYKHMKSPGKSHESPMGVTWKIHGSTVNSWETLMRTVQPHESMEVA